MSKKLAQLHFLVAAVLLQMFIFEGILHAQGVSFIARRDFAAGVNPVSVAVADFNGDGNADLAVVNPNSNGFSILLGNGDGSFQL